VSENCARNAPRLSVRSESGLVYCPLFMGAGKGSGDALQNLGRNRGDFCILFKARRPKRNPGLKRMWRPKPFVSIPGN